MSKKLESIIAITVVAALVIGFTWGSLIGTTSASPDEPESIPSPTGRIAFSSNHDGDYEIYSMDPDGSNRTRLTYSTGDDLMAAWSPDGTRIAFSSDRTGDFEIYVMDVDGSNQTRITYSAGNDFQPTWSPDCTRIAFGSQRDGNDEIYVMNTDGSNQTNLTNNSGIDNNPDWSPLGDKIAFAGDSAIYVMDVDGSNRALLSNSYGDSQPAWSPDGTKIAFYSKRDGNIPQIYVMDADGGNQTNISNSSRDDVDPTWSPDGTKIAFQSAEPPGSDPWQIYVMDADGSNQTNISNNEAIETYPSWGLSGDGDHDGDGITDEEDLDDDNDEFSDNTEAEATTDPKDASSFPTLEEVRDISIDTINEWTIDDQEKKDALVNKLSDIYEKLNQAKNAYNQFNSLENMINDLVSEGVLSDTDAMSLLSLAVELLPSKSAQYEPIVEEEGYVYHWFTFNEEQIQEIAYSTSDAYLYANWMTDYIFTFSGGWGLGIARFIGHTSLTNYIIDKAGKMIENNPEAFDDDTITVEMNVTIRSRTDKIGEWALRIGDFIASKWRQLAKGF